MKNKTVTSILAVTLAMSLTACSSKNSGSEQPAAQQSTASDAAVSETTSAAAETTEATTESADSTELFNKFLNNEADLMLHISLENDLYNVCTLEQESEGKFYTVHTFDSAQSFTFDELTACVRNSPETDASGAVPSYAVMDTLSGQKALVIKYTNVNIEPSGDIGSAYFVITDHNGELSLVYAGDSWSRRSLELYEGCVFSKAGSSGAGSQSNGFFCIGDNGKYSLIYDQNIYTNQWVAQEFDLFPGDNTWTEGVTVTITTTPDDKFFSFVAADSALGDKLGTLVETLQTNGYVYASKVLELENERLDKFGIVREELTPFNGWTEIQ